MQHTIRSPGHHVTRWIVCALVGWLLQSVVPAAEPAAQPTSAATNFVTGKWTYTLEVSLDTSLDFTAELKQEGENVTGFVTVQELKTAIEKGKFKDGQLTFEIPREYGGVKFTSRYSGKLAGEKLTGKIISGTAPLERTYEWNAKREKPPVKP